MTNRDSETAQACEPEPITEKDASLWPCVTHGVAGCEKCWPRVAPPAESDAAEHWHEGGDGHGYGYQYIGPIHYMCECGQHFLDREGWRRHRETLDLATDSLPRCSCVTSPAASAACGVTFQHDSHGYLDDDGRTRVCDGGSDA